MKKLMFCTIIATILTLALDDVDAISSSKGKASSGTGTYKYSVLNNKKADARTRKSLDGAFKNWGDYTQQTIDVINKLIEEFKGLTRDYKGKTKIVAALNKDLRELNVIKRVLEAIIKQDPSGDLIKKIDKAQKVTLSGYKSIGNEHVALNIKRIFKELPSGLELVDGGIMLPLAGKYSDFVAFILKLADSAPSIGGDSVGTNEVNALSSDDTEALDRAGGGEVPA